MNDIQELRRAEVDNARDDPQLRWLYNQAWAMRLAPTRGEADMRALLDAEEIEYIPQQVMRPYIVDFYLPAYDIVIEVDGSAHKGQEEKDAIRQARIERRGVTFVRYSNKDVVAWRNLIREDWPESE